MRISDWSSDLCSSDLSLLFGKRSAAHDGFHTGELQAWRENGSLQRLELVYSRDQPQRRYVQEALVEAAAEVRQWVAEGAAIYVCGSLRDRKSTRLNSSH